jgi:hypothetical protein
MFSNPLYIRSARGETENAESLRTALTPIPNQFLERLAPYPNLAQFTAIYRDRVRSGTIYHDLARFNRIRFAPF